MEQECRQEHSNLIKIIQQFKCLITDLKKNDEIKEKIEKNQIFKKLKENYETLSKNILDEDYFHCMLGESFESECYYNNICNSSDCPSGEDILIKEVEEELEVEDNSELDLDAEEAEGQNDADVNIEGESDAAALESN